MLIKGMPQIYRAPDDGGAGGAADPGAGGGDPATQAGGAGDDTLISGGDHATQAGGDPDDTLLSGDGGGVDGDDDEGNKDGGDFGEPVTDPTAYTFEAPEGYTLSADAEAILGDYRKFAAEHGLSQKQFEAGLKFDQTRNLAEQNYQRELFKIQVREWGDTVRSDRELGGDNLTTTLSHSEATLSAFGTPVLRQLMAMPSDKNPAGLGLGNHPEMVRFLSRIGKAIGDSELIEGGAATGSATQEEALRKMYPSMFEDEAA